MSESVTAGPADVGAYLRDLFGLEGRRALVTGASSGIGAAAARALGGAGADVVVGGRDAARATQVADAIAAAGGRASVEVGDLSEPDRAEAFAQRVLDRHGEIDVLVNCAGVFRRSPAEATTRAMWDETLALNVTAMFVLCQVVGRRMIAAGRGKIVNVASTDGFVGVAEQAAYCASKGAVVQLTRTLGAEWIKHGVHVNAIGPCDFDTPMIADVLNEPEYRDWILDAIPAGRVGRPEEIAGAVVYLASSASDMVVGEVLMVDGGRVAI
jgi:NAD(P)-dependent dehydrogenase (short-subunit alcohol dehydrogenase family)